MMKEHSPATHYSLPNKQKFSISILLRKLNSWAPQRVEWNNLIVLNLNGKDSHKRTIFSRVIWNTGRVISLSEDPCAINARYLECYLSPVMLITQRKLSTPLACRYHVHQFPVYLFPMAVSLISLSKSLSLHERLEITRFHYRCARVWLIAASALSLAPLSLGLSLFYSALEDS